MRWFKKKVVGEGLLVVEAQRRSIQWQMQEDWIRLANVNDKAIIRKRMLCLITSGSFFFLRSDRNTNASDFRISGCGKQRDATGCKSLSRNATRAILSAARQHEFYRRSHIA